MTKTDDRSIMSVPNESVHKSFGHWETIGYQQDGEPIQKWARDPCACGTTAALYTSADWIAVTCQQCLKRFPAAIKI